MKSILTTTSIVLSLLTTAFPSVSAQGHASDGSWRDQVGAVRLAATPDCLYRKKGSGEIELLDGTLLIDAAEPVIISSPLSRIQFEKGTLAVLRVRNGAEHVMQLLQSSNVLYGRHAGKLSCGDEGFIADHAPEVREILFEDGIGRRRVRTDELSNGLHLTITEFSLVQAMEREPLLYSFLHSGDKRDKALKDKLIKMAAILGVATARHGQYSTAPQ